MHFWRRRGEIFAPISRNGEGRKKAKLWSFLMMMSSGLFSFSDSQVSGLLQVSRLGGSAKKSWCWANASRGYCWVRLLLLLEQPRRSRVCSVKGEELRNSMSKAACRLNFPLKALTCCLLAFAWVLSPHQLLPLFLRPSSKWAGIPNQIFDSSLVTCS